MTTTGNRWALVLAAGSGTRLSALTAGAPKQYCSLSGGPSLLREALDRAGRFAPPERTVVIVADEHRTFWRRELAGHPAENVVVQPLNRGTAVGILLPLLAILDRDRDARIAMFPSDHFVADEAVLQRSVERGFRVVEGSPERIVLLGVEPDAPDSEYGWIVPGAPFGDDAFGIHTFVEKPRPELATGLLHRGGVWNSFILVAHGAELRALYARRRPSLLGALAFAPRDPGPALSRLYAALPSSDFSRELLQGSEDRLALVPVPFCGWSDLGTPARVEGCVSRWRRQAATFAAAFVEAPVNLSALVAGA